MVDVQTISIVIAASSVVTGVDYHILQIRHQTRTRGTDLIVRLCSMFGGKEFQEAWRARWHSH